MTQSPPLGEPRLLDDEHRAITIGLVVAITLVAFEGTAVITALPVIARELDGLAIFAWAVNAFVAGGLIGQVMAGEWGDRLGPRFPMVVGISTFAAGAIVAGTAVSFPMLLAGRALLGFGAGAAIVAGYVVIARAYEPMLRPRAFSLISSAWVLPSLVGPVIAGWLADSVSWRWVFLLVLLFIWPPVVVMLPRLARYGGAAEGARPRPGRRRAGLMAAAGLVAVQDGAQRLGPWGAFEALAGLVLLIPALRVLLPPGTLRLRRGLASTVAVRGLLAAAFFSAEAWIPLALSSVRSVSTTWAGLFLATGSVGWALGAWFQGHPPRGWTAPRIVQAGSVLVLASLLLLPLSMLPAVAPWTLGLGWIVGAAGMGMSITALSTLTLGYSSADAQGANSAALQVSDSSGVVILTGLTGAMFAYGLAQGGAGGPTFTAMWLVSAAVGAVAVVVAARV